MWRLVTSALAALAALALGSTLCEAGFIVSCDVLAVARVDPIVSPGQMSKHVHAFYGSNALAPTVTYNDTQRSCTSCNVVNDHSLYWMPTLYRQEPGGKFSLVPIERGRVYYRSYNNAKTEFPSGFKIVAGNATAKGRQPFVFFTCDGNPRANVLGRFPNSICRTWTAKVVFPSCWNRKPIDLADTSKHMSYPEQGLQGSCPASHPVQLMTLEMWMTFAVGSIRNAKVSEFTLSNGDRDGFSMHADFVAGWPDGFLKKAIDCNGNRCPQLRPLKGNVATQQCRVPPAAIPDEPIRWVDVLPGTPTFVPSPPVYATR